MEQLISHSLILYWWIYSEGWPDLFIPLAFFGLGIFLAYRVSSRKGLSIFSTVLFVIVIACEVLATAVFHRHMAAILPLIVGSVALSVLLGIGVFVLLRAIVHQVRCKK